MAEPEILRSLFRNTAEKGLGHLKTELGYRHMTALADTFTGWAHDPRLTAEQSAEMLGLAEALTRLAEQVGPHWNPPDPVTVGIMGFLARQALGETSPPSTKLSP